MVFIVPLCELFASSIFHYFSSCCFGSVIYKDAGVVSINLRTHKLGQTKAQSRSLQHIIASSSKKDCAFQFAQVLVREKNES